MKFNPPRATTKPTGESDAVKEDGDVLVSVVWATAVSFGMPRSTYKISALKVRLLVSANSPSPPTVHPTNVPDDAPEKQGEPPTMHL